MRLGGPLFEKISNPEEWIAATRRAGYSATVCPVGLETPSKEIAAYRNAAERADILISEVGAWSNPIDRDAAKQKQAIEHCQRHLALADEIGALCCVNIAGSRGPVWDGPDPANDSVETFDLIVESVRAIIDAVKPRRTVYSLETMPWIAPDSPESYLALLRAIDRKAFGVHLDPVNMINCPSRMYHTGAFLKECFSKLGPIIVGCHAKDIKFSRHLTLHLDECCPGDGVLDYRVYLAELAALSQDVPLMLEHLKTAEQYATAADYIRRIAAEIGAKLQ
jgi:sugar phosphate isomerase/epimerase